MISIAMTTYNGEKYVIEQLESLRDQSKKPDEIVIVDDCSTDNTTLMIKKFIKDNKLEKWQLYLLEENIGYKKAFQIAIKKTKGDVIFLCDHDDIWLNNKLELMSGCMKRNSKILALNSSFIKIDDIGNKILSKNYLFSSNNNLIRKRINKDACIKLDIERLVSYNISPGCTLAFRSNLIEILGKLENDDYDLVHDWKINVIAAGKQGLYFLNTPTTLYRLHSNNTIGLQKKMTINARIIEYTKLLAERKYLTKIIEYQCKNPKVFEGVQRTTLLKTIDINESIEDRITKLKNVSFIKYLFLPIKHKALRGRMIESWLLDLYIILKS